MYLTYQRNKVWQNSLTLWQDVVAKSPDKARGHFNLGGALIAYDQKEQGIAELLYARQLDPSLSSAVDTVLFHIAR